MNVMVLNFLRAFTYAFNWRNSPIPLRVTFKNKTVVTTLNYVCPNYKRTLDLVGSLIIV